MKKTFLTTLAFLGFIYGIDAQACQKTGAACCANKKMAAANTQNSAPAATLASVTSSEAELAAAADASIQKRVCPETGKVSFYQKSVSETSGKVAWNEVAYDGTTQKFTKVASASMEKDPATGEIKKKESCCSKVSGSASCDKEKAAGCCASKKKEGTK